MRFAPAPRFAVRIAIALTLVAGVVAFRAFGRDERSPFALGSVRAGAPLAELRAQASRHMPHDFTCESIGPLQLCTARTDGPTGAMRVVVDDRGRAAIVELSTRDTTRRFREQTRQLDADWSLVSQRRPGPAASATRWVSRDERWSAELRAGQPVRMRLLDERWLADLETEDAASLLRLARVGLVDDAVLARAERRRPGLLGRAAAQALAEPRALAQRAAGLSACGRLPTIALPARDSSRAMAFGARHLAVAEQTVSRAFPGSRLVAGDDRFYLVDASGAEEISLSPFASAGEHHAFVVSFPGRLTTAEERAIARDAGTQCRAVSELVVARVDQAAGGVTAVRRLAIDRDALLSRVGELEFVSVTERALVLVMRTVAVYGTADWDAQLEWRTVVTADDSDDGVLAVAARIPTRYARRIGTHERSGVMVAPDGAPPTAGALRLDVLEDVEGLPHITHLVVPREPAEPISGWTLLSLL